MVNREFDKTLKSKERDFLIISEVMRYRTPEAFEDVDFSHLGMIFQIDADKDGRFSIEDLI